MRPGGAPTHMMIQLTGPRIRTYVTVPSVQPSQLRSTHLHFARSLLSRAHCAQPMVNPVSVPARIAGPTPVQMDAPIGSSGTSTPIDVSHVSANPIACLSPHVITNQANSQTRTLAPANESGSH